MKRHLAALAVALLLTQLFTVSNSLAQAPQGILISQYYEGFSGNKYIEIWNPTDNEVILLGIRITLWSNSNRENWKTGTGAPTASLDLGSISPGRTLKPGQFLLIANPSAVSPTYAANTADARAEKAGEQIANFNGDDSIVLYSSDMYAPDNILDSFSLSSNSAADKSFYRISTGKGYDLSPQSQSSDFSSVWAEKAITDVNLASPADDFYLTASSALSVPATKVPPTVVIKSATMRGATGLMDVVFRVNDPDDATVKTRALAFIDGQRSFAKVIKPTTFAEGTESKLGDAIASNTDHTLTWNVAADWNISLGQIKFEILAMDTRGLLPLDWVTIPAANGQPELTISKNAPTDQETLDALFWQYASGDPGLKVEQGLLRGSEDIGVLSGSSLVAGSSICSPGVVYALKTMNLSPAGTAEITRSVAARAIKWDTERWHAVKEPYQDFGRLVAWGRNDASQTNAPEGLGPATKAISAGEDHNLVLMKDGTVTAWGGNAYGQCSIPENLSNVSAIAAGFFSSFAVKADGTVVGWGYDYYNQLKIPAGLSGVKAISASSHCLALKTNGTVVGWGSNHSGQAIVPSSLSDVVAVATGDGHSLALKADGTVVSWGYNASGQTDVPAGLTGVVKIAAAGSHSIAVKANGTVVAWGYNLDGATDVPEGLSDVIDVAAGNSFNIALKADGSMVAWGYNQFGQTIIPQNVFPVVAVSGRGAHVLAVSLRDAP